VLYPTPLYVSIAWIELNSPISRLANEKHKMSPIRDPTSGQAIVTLHSKINC